MGLTPHDLDTERALLGLLLDAPHLAEQVGVAAADLDPARRHPEILDAILTVQEQTRAADPTLIVDHLLRTGWTDAGPYLAGLLTEGRGRLPNVHHYAEIIRDRSMRRGLVAAATRINQAATTVTDRDAMLDVAAQESIHLSLLVDTPTDSDAPLPGLDADANAAMDLPPNPRAWVIPGLLQRADRVLIVSREGVGKSELARQVAVLTAAGRHPFVPAAQIAPRRVLLVDLENPPDYVLDSLRALRARLPGGREELAERLRLWAHPAGLDLRTPAGRALLTRAIDRHRPELVVLGPLYKAAAAHAGDTWELDAKETSLALDAVRERYGVALWLEHHCPKGDDREPVGSGLWKRWPEFGRALFRPAEAEPNIYELHRFRGDRARRLWPDRLIKRAGPWPWTADWDDQEERADLYLACEQDRQ